MPISEKQLEANRANAARSTGPQRRFNSSTSTPGGKARSCQNARTHGFTASTFAVARLESAIFTTCLEMALNHDGAPFTAISPELVGNGDLSLGIKIARAYNRNCALGNGFHRLARKDNTFPLLFRYKVWTERLYRRAVEEFDRLKRLRPELPNEPIVEVQPEENEPDCAPTDEPASSLAPEDRAVIESQTQPPLPVHQDKSCAPELHNPDLLLVGQAVSPVTAGCSRRLVAPRLLQDDLACPARPTLEGEAD